MSVLLEMIHRIQPVTARTVNGSLSLALLWVASCVLPLEASADQNSQVASDNVSMKGAKVARHPEAGTREVSDLYIETTFGLNHDALTDIYTSDAVFFDATGDVFAGLVDAPFPGPVRGAERIVAMQKSWGDSAIQHAVCPMMSWP